MGSEKWNADSLREKGGWKEEPGILYAGKPTGLMGVTPISKIVS